MPVLATYFSVRRGRDPFFKFFMRTIFPRQVREYELDALDLGVERCDPGELRGGDAETNAEALRKVLGGEDGGHRSAVILNAAGGIAAAGEAENLRDGIALARATIDSGAAAARLGELVEFSQS